MKILGTHRHNALTTSRIFPNQREVQTIVDLKNNSTLKWFLTKTVQLIRRQQTHVKIDLVIPTVASNLTIQYVNFFFILSSLGNTIALSQSTVIFGGMIQLIEQITTKYNAEWRQICEESSKSIKKMPAVFFVHHGEKDSRQIIATIPAETMFSFVCVCGSSNTSLIGQVLFMHH